MASDHNGQENGSPNQWIIGVKVIPIHRYSPPLESVDTSFGDVLSGLWAGDVLSGLWAGDVQTDLGPWLTLSPG